MDKTLQEVQQWKEDSFKYQHLKSRYVDYAKRLSEGMAIIESVINELDPTLLSNPRSTFTPIITEAYELLRKGRELTRENIESYYELSYVKASYIMQRLQKMPNVLTKKEGRTAILYLQVPTE